MTGYSFDTIFTLEARSNIFLESMCDHLKLTDRQAFDEIQGLFQQLRDLLTTKGTPYAELRGALSPSIDRNERAFVFDWMKCGTASYGVDVMHHMLPLLDRRSTHSVLCGDWHGPGNFTEWLSASPVAVRDEYLLRAGGSGSFLYFVYLNNLSDAMVDRIDRELCAFPPYLGNLNLNLASPIKAYVSTLLVRVFIKHRNIILVGHEDDRDDSDNVSLLLYDFARFGLTIKSVPLLLFGLFLSYKIERPVFENEYDTKFSLNALTPNPIGLENFTIDLDERKLAYLKDQKAGSLKRANLNGISAEAICKQIRDKIQSNYIYELARSTNGQTLKFSIVLEFNGTRAQCVLEYGIASRSLRVITFY